MKNFQKADLKRLYHPTHNSNGEDNGQVTIIGGSELFHGAPLLALKTASRIVDMVFFTSPEPSFGDIALSLKSELSSFIWVPWDDVDAYIKKSDAILIGPGMMRFSSEKELPAGGKLLDKAGLITKNITERLLKNFSDKKWVIDAGSLQVMDADWIPPKAIVTPNRKEFELLFGLKADAANIKNMAEKYDCIVVAKGAETIIASIDGEVSVRGGNPGLTKGGSGDILAGLTVALLAKNDPLLAASAASYLEKAASDELYKKVGTNYNMDDLADKIPEVYRNLITG
jgi:NAD(P)H-hydrate epimerase